MGAFFKLTSKHSGELIAFFEFDVKDDNDLDYLNSFKETSSYVQQISLAEYDLLFREKRGKCYFFDLRV
ncbi:hypothetical protein OCK74_18940 [Chitinophagaceae bacterium LB-8]|uniref:Uncharacterized protein n=1 Tax=Paraflavisolibacter caeni TaxID=2982496 RepID=A0A9X2XXZ6_9BACT|nr:hypothetical protein [Paraflavisolibacter caeni]MCU7551205.1 hypothetical protein [Paraflavisolibacter caeni]